MVEYVHEADAYKVELVINTIINKEFIYLLCYSNSKIVLAKIN
jgi:hypothetical protein